MGLTNVDIDRVDGSTGTLSTLTTTALTTSTLNGLAYPTSGSLSGRNRIINGDMRIDQRNDGATVSGGSGGYNVDRWKSSFSVSGKFNYGRSTVAPAGFTNSLLHTVAVAHTSAAGDALLVEHFIEGFNTADLNFGTASAVPITVSFWVRSSVTGTYSVAIANGSDDRAYVTTYAVKSANTWEYKSVTIPGDTTGTWATDNGKGVSLKFDLGSGSTYVAASTNSWVGTNTFKASGSTSLAATNGATFYITGVQLEAGSVATPFERRSYGQELALCQRYYYQLTGRMYVSGNSTQAFGFTHLVTMRAAPSMAIVSGVGTNPTFSDVDTTSVSVLIGSGAAYFSTQWSAAAEL